MVKIGDALKRAVEEETPTTEDTGKRARISSVLMNPNRRDLFKILCQSPCSSAGNLTARLSLSRATVNWHLKALVKANYIESFRFNNKQFFSPKDMVSHGDAMVVIATLNDSRCKTIFKVIVDNYGIDTPTLRESVRSIRSITPHLQRLEALGLISTVKDGNLIHYYPTSKLDEIINLEGSRLKIFRRTLIKRMENDHLMPRVEKIKGSGLVILLQIFEPPEEIFMPYRPMEIILASE